MAELFDETSENIELKLDEADKAAKESDIRYNAEEVFGRLRRKLKGAVKMKKIIKNAIKCNHCGDIIVSKDRHDFVSCKCGCCSVNGGNDYLRRGFINSKEDFTEMSEFEYEENT